VVPSFQINSGSAPGAWKPALFHNLPGLTITPELAATSLIDAVLCSAAAPLFFGPHTIPSGVLPRRPCGWPAGPELEAAPAFAQVSFGVASFTRASFKRCVSKDGRGRRPCRPPSFETSDSPRVTGRPGMRPARGDAGLNGFTDPIVSAGTTTEVTPSPTAARRRGRTRRRCWHWRHRAAGPPWRRNRESNRDGCRRA